MTAATNAATWQRIKSLLADALEQPPAERQGFVEARAGTDEALRAEVMALLAAAEPSRSGLDAVPAALALEVLNAHEARSWLGRRVGNYRLVSLIARGGMGQVYLAERVDGQYEQDVAIKLMREGLSDDAFVARFKAERQILASLEHPNLAKVLDGGITEEGVPYFVMERVVGDPIDVHCRERGVSVDDTLNLFRSVCQVVHYAHRSGVVHRDLKPSNILVTVAGVVKLVDFGIARRVSVAAPATATAQRVMTLEYASPEQVRGDEVTPASDIYSLGVLLYSLVAQSGPYAQAADDYELRKAICDSEPLPPSRAAFRTGRARSRRLLGDLDAVVLMALRKDPARRYATAEHLSDDLFRHLEGLPVLARRGAWSYRAGRFMLRHRALFGFAVAANIMLATGLGVAAYQYNEANAQRQRAEHHLASVRKLANVFIFDIHDAIQDLPGATSARKALVDHALIYLQELDTGARSDPALQLELAAGYRKIADIQGGPMGSNLGDPKAARLSYQRAQGLAEQVMRQQPGPGLQRLNEARRELARTVRSLAALQATQGEFDVALAGLQTGIAAAEAAVSADGSDPSNRRVLAALHTQRSQLLMMAGRGEEFLAASDVAVRQLEELLAQDPGNAQVGGNLASAYGMRGQHLLNTGDTSELGARAMAELRKGAAVLERLVRQHPENTQLMMNLSATHNHTGVAWRAMNNPKEAAASRRRALQLLAPLLAKDPNDAMVRVDYGSCASGLSEDLLAAGDVEQSVAVAADALAAFESAPEGARNHILALHDYAWALRNHGKALRARAGMRGRAAEAASADRTLACSSLRRSLRQLERREEQFAADAMLARDGDQLRKELKQELSTCR